MKTKDKLGRRFRFSPSQPSGENVVLTGRDYTWLQALHDHRQLPSNYLHAFTADRHRSRAASGRRITALRHDGGYLNAPRQQRDTAISHANNLVLGLSHKGELALSKRSAISPFAPETNNEHWWHDLYTNCVAASIDLACRKEPETYRFIPHHAVCERYNHPMRFEVDTEDRRREVRPDRTFIIENLKEGTARLYFLEMDCSTEQLRTTKNSRKTFEQKLRNYRALIGRRQYQNELGISIGAIVLVVTLGPGRMRNMLDLVDDMTEGKGNNFLTFRTMPHHAEFYQPPPVMAELFTEPWNRAGQTPLYLGQ